MATSGTVITNIVDQNTYYYVNWQQASQSISGNYTDINWQHGVNCRYDYGSNALQSYGVNINGTSVYGGGTYSGLNQGTHQLASGTIRINHNSDGTKTFNISTSGWVIGEGSVSGSQDFTLNKINRYGVTNSVTGSDIEGNFIVDYTKYIQTYTYKLRISIPNVRELETIDYNTSGTEFQLSQETIEDLYTTYTTTNTFNLGFAVETWSSDGNTRLSYGNEKIITAKITGATPIFSDFDFADINATTLALTGNSKYNVNGYSTIRVTISTANKAVAQKGASMIQYRFIVGNTTRTMAYNDSSDVYIDIPNSTVGTYQVYAEDSRGNSTLVTKFATQNIEYQDIYLDNGSSYVERDDGGVGEDVTLTYRGTIWNNSFGSVTNSVTSATYQYKETGSNTWITPSNPTTITPTISDGIMSFSALIRSNESDYKFPVNKSYNFKITIEDELSSYEIILNPLPSGIPNISLNENGVGIMCDYDESLGGLLQVGGEIIGEYTDTYSTTEFETNKVWIDNKPIYRKVVSVNFPTTSSATATTNHSISNISMITNYWLMWYDTTDQRWFNFYKDTSGSNYVQIDGITSTQVRVKANNTGVNWNGRTKNKYAIIEYTKTS